MIRKLVATAVVMLAVASGVAAAAPSYPATIALPRGFQPEGISIRANTFYVGSIPTGSIYRGNLRTGTGSVFIQRSGRAAIGIERTTATGCSSRARPTGKAFVYNARHRRGHRRVHLAPGFINDVVVTRTGAYFTNSNRAELYRIPIGTGGRLGSTVQTIALKPPYVQGAGFNVNGIDATPNGTLARDRAEQHREAVPGQPVDRRNDRDRARRGERAERRRHPARREDAVRRAEPAEPDRGDSRERRAHVRSRRHAHHGRPLRRADDDRRPRSPALRRQRAVRLAPATTDYHGRAPVGVRPSSRQRDR